MEASRLGHLACVLSLLPGSELAAHTEVRPPSQLGHHLSALGATSEHVSCHGHAGVPSGECAPHSPVSRYGPTDSTDPYPQAMDTALHYAANNGHPDCVRALLAAGARADVRNKVWVNRCRAPACPLTRGSLRSDPGCRLLLCTAPVPRPTSVSSPMQGTASPLHCAAVDGHTECVKALLEFVALIEGLAPVRVAACQAAQSQYRGWRGYSVIQREMTIDRIPPPPPSA